MRGALKLAAAALFFAAAAAQAAPAHKLLVLSVDGLDWRYLRDRDAMGLRIPNFRRLLAKGEVADGVIGVWPTITWPSHTSIITGVRPDQTRHLEQWPWTDRSVAELLVGDQAEGSHTLAMCRRKRTDDSGGNLAGHHGCQDHLQFAGSVRAAKWRLDGSRIHCRPCDARFGGRNLQNLSILPATMDGRSHPHPGDAISAETQEARSHSSASRRSGFGSARSGAFRPECQRDSGTHR